MAELARFTCQCRGIKFYQLAEVGAQVSSVVRFKREPRNPHDPNSVIVSVCCGGQEKRFGHVARKAAWWLFRLLEGPFRNSG